MKKIDIKKMNDLKYSMYYVTGKFEYQYYLIPIHANLPSLLFFPFSWVLSKPAILISELQYSNFNKAKKSKNQFLQFVGISLFGQVVAKTIPQETLTRSFLTLIAPILVIAVSILLLLFSKIKLRHSLKTKGIDCSHHIYKLNYRPEKLSIKIIFQVMLMIFFLFIIIVVIKSYYSNMTLSGLLAIFFSSYLYLLLLPVAGVVEGSYRIKDIKS
ncbi:hypothetical protein ACM0P9_05645 [Streptococcus pluranimalium]